MRHNHLWYKCDKHIDRQQDKRCFFCFRQKTISWFAILWYKNLWKATSQKKYSLPFYSNVQKEVIWIMLTKLREISNIHKESTNAKKIKSMHSIKIFIFRTYFWLPIWAAVFKSYTMKMIQHIPQTFNRRVFVTFYFHYSIALSYSEFVWKKF